MAKNLIAGFKLFPKKKKERNTPRPKLSEKTIAERGGIAWVTSDGITIFNSDIQAIGEITSTPWLPTRTAKDQGNGIILLPGGEKWDITKQSYLSLEVTTKTVPKVLDNVWTPASELEQEIEDDIQFMHSLLMNGLSPSFEIEIHHLLLKNLWYNGEKFFDECYWTTFRITDPPFLDSVKISGSPGKWYCEMYVLCNKNIDKMIFQITAGSSLQPDKWLWGAGYLYQGIDREDLVTFDFSELGQRELKIRYNSINP